MSSLPRWTTVWFVALLAIPAIGWSQVAGGAAAMRPQGDPTDLFNRQRNLGLDEIPPTLDSTFLDASVLLNIHADAFVIVFGVGEDGPTLGEAREKVHVKIANFRNLLKSLGVPSGQISTDFISQNRNYGFSIVGNIATEQVVGFEDKENVSVRCTSKEWIDKLTDAAAKAGIFDLVKVDYILSDIGAVKSRLREAAAGVIHQKKSDYQRLFGIKLQDSPQLYAEKFNAFYPSDMYASYQAAEGENLDRGFDQRNFVIHGARKMNTYYYNPMASKTFDRVINPVVTDPVVQCTLYLRLRFVSGKDTRLMSIDRPRN